MILSDDTVLFIAFGLVTGTGVFISFMLWGFRMALVVWVLLTLVSMMIGALI